MLCRPGEVLFILELTTTKHVGKTARFSKIKKQEIQNPNSTTTTTTNRMPVKFYFQIHDEYFFKYKYVLNIAWNLHE